MGLGPVSLPMGGAGKCDDTIPGAAPAGAAAALGVGRGPPCSPIGIAAHLQAATRPMGIAMSAVLDATSERNPANRVGPQRAQGPGDQRQQHHKRQPHVESDRGNA